MVKSVKKQSFQAKGLKFKVAPHIVQDLGLNLYTSLPRVLVEFVANAYDADSPDIDIAIDVDAIEEARAAMKANFDVEKKQREIQKNRGKPLPDLIRLEERTLPESIQIVIEDHGHGMSRSDLGEKFLIAGRRRREEKDGWRSPDGRIVMGRKGLGKLAGFGVAHRVEVTTRKKGEKHATRILLDYDELITKRSTDEIDVREQTLTDGGGIKPHGTRVVLSKLVHEPMKSGVSAIAHAIGDHFVLVDADDFAIRLNENPVKPTPRKHVYAWPKPKTSPNSLVRKTLTLEDGEEVSFNYRIRFTGPGQHLPARERGVRVYAHKRLAAAPDLLDVPTGMHGFRQTDYMDGVVHADFIDEQPAEYIATDRQSLRWEAPLLQPMREFLSKEMKEGATAYQYHRQKEAEKVTQEDPYTKKLIDAARLPQARLKVAYKIAESLSNHVQGGIDSTEYRKQLRILVGGLGQGTILRAMADLAQQDHPDIDRLIGESIRLTKNEFSELARFFEGKISGIQALRRIVRDQDFKAKDREKELHSLFKNAPWLMNPQFTQLIVSDETVSTFFGRLAKALKIDNFAPTKGKNVSRRADLVFLLGNKGLEKLVIIELKAPNIELIDEHLTQLEDYMQEAANWLADHGHPKMHVEGMLIGSRAPSSSRAQGVLRLNRRIEQKSDKQMWQVLDILQVLEQTEEAHKELLASYEVIAGEAMLNV